MSNEPGAITLKWCEVTPALKRAELFAVAEGAQAQVEAAKRKMVSGLIGREIGEDEKASGAWLTYLAETNDLPDERPICSELLGAMQENPGCLAFGFFLA